MSKGFNDPFRLYTTCLNYICNNLNLVTTNLSHKQHVHHHHHLHNYHKSHAQLEFCDPSIRFNHVISEDLLEKLGQLGKLDDSTLSLFVNDQTCLRKLHIRNVNLSRDLIRAVLKRHNINELCINNVQFVTYPNIEPAHHQDDYANYLVNIQQPIQNTPNISSNCSISINDLTEGLNDWSRENLKYLNVARNSTLFGSILINLDKLKSLTKLNVSYTCFNNHSLDIITQDLHNLEYLDLSGTKVNNLTPLSRLKDKLRHLYMYNMRASIGDDIVASVTCLVRLVYLDLSCDVSNKIFADMSLSLFDANLLLDELASTMLSDFKYLDISGKLGIRQESLIRFLRSYPNLKFLGLALTNANSFEIFNENAGTIEHKTIMQASFSSPDLTNLAERNLVANDPQTKLSTRLQNYAGDLKFTGNDLIVTGESNESQLVASLKYYKTRNIYVQRALYNLFIISRNFQETKIELIELILELMQIHSKSHGVQLAATTCIFNLTRLNLYTKIPTHILSHIIASILKTMITFPSNIILQKNCLYILLNEEMLQSCPFNKFDCVKVTLDCFIMYNDPNIINSSLAICSQVAANAEQKYRRKFVQINESKYLKKLIEVVKNSTQNVANDSVLQSVLDILWSLSEENIELGRNFIDNDGLNTFSDLIVGFENDTETILKSIYLIYNLSEIGQIRPNLFHHRIINVIKRILYHDEMRIKFNAVGFFVNLLGSMNGLDWDNSFINPIKISDFKKELEYIIDSWTVYEIKNMKRYSSKVLLELMKSYEEPIGQKWALWAFYQIADDYWNENYLREEILQCAIELKQNSPNENVKILCSNILNLVKRNGS